jgi:hypothetical protein
MTARLIAASVLLAATAATPSTGTDAGTAVAAEPATKVTIEKLRQAAAHVPGWTEQKDGYRAFTARELYGIIDGGAVMYEQQGLVRGAVVSLTGSSRSLEVYLEEFESPSRATGMAAIKKQASAAPRDLPGARSGAVYDEVLGGCVVYWATGRHYFEMVLTGYGALEVAIRDATTFVEAMTRAATE